MESWLLSRTEFILCMQMILSGSHCGQSNPISELCFVARVQGTHTHGFSTYTEARKRNRRGQE